MNPKRRLPLSLKLNLLIVSVILIVTGGLVGICYRIYSLRVNEFYLSQSELAAEAAKEEILPELAAHLWQEINTDAFRKIREEALAAGDESLIRKWMISRPSFVNADQPFSIQVDFDSYEDIVEQEKMPEDDNLYRDYQILIHALEECKRLFDITDVYIQYDYNKITYNLADPVEDLFYIGSVEEQIDIFADYNDNEYFPPTIYQSDFGWLCTTLLPLDKTIDDVIPGYIGVDTDMNYVVRQRRIFLVNSGIYILVLTGAAILISVLLLRRAAVDPLHQLALAARSFAKNDDELTKEDVIELPIRSNDEISDLYHEIRSMETRIIDYTDHMTRITADRERVRTELHMAEEIQRSMIPREFPDRTEFDLYASMTPAREVGGDFYDFFMLDDRHLAVIIADVSDKGVPAALFMMSSKILINYRARQGGTPAEILTDVNAQICLSNKSKMFVTVWMGILDLSTGEMTCANAGHEYPFFRHADGSFHMIRDKHGFVVGGLSATKYTDYELRLEPGDAVFVYTDGVPEANNSDGELYGMKRLEYSLNQASGQAPRTILKQIENDVGAFVKEAKQFDDLTMLCVAYNGKDDPESDPLPRQS